MIARARATTIHQASHRSEPATVSSDTRRVGCISRRASDQSRQEDARSVFTRLRDAGSARLASAKHHRHRQPRERRDLHHRLRRTQSCRAGFRAHQSQLHHSQAFPRSQIRSSESAASAARLFSTTCDRKDRAASTTFFIASPATLAASFSKATTTSVRGSSESIRRSTRDTRSHIAARIKTSTALFAK